jgi:hypothetical protein
LSQDILKPSFDLKQENQNGGIEMKRTEFKKIDMELVKEIISKKGFYYFSLDRVYERFCGANYIIVTDDPHFKEQHPRFAKEIIVTPAQFELYAAEYNDRIAYDDRERKRILKKEERLLNEAELTADGTVENQVMRKLQNEQIYSAVKNLTDKQKKRVIRYFYYGLTERKIAEIENVSYK